MTPSRTMLARWTLITLIASACSPESSMPPQEAVRESAPARMQQSPAEEEVSGAVEIRKLIRTAELELEVESVDRATLLLGRIAERYHGLIADTEDARDDAGRRRAVIRLRVPSADFDAAVDEIARLGGVQRKQTSTQDVTKAYADLELRLGVKRQMEERLRALLASRTGDLSEVLQVERELGRIIEEIEQLLGERRFYDNRIALSDIRVELFEPRSATMPGLVAPIRDALSASLSVLASSFAALIYVVAFLVPWALLAAPVWWMGSRLKRRRRPVVESRNE